MKQNNQAVMAIIAGTIVFVGSVFADVTYKEPPADTAMIKVAGGTTTVAGLEAYSHLTHYWSFDDAENYLTDSTGKFTFGKLPGSTTITHETAEGAKLGAGAVTVNAGLQVPKNVITGQEFTVSFWLRPNDKTNTGAEGTYSQGSIFYVGEAGSATAKRLLLGYANKNTEMFFWDTGSHKSTLSHTTVPGDWEHWAITRDSENTVKVYLNGTSMTTTTYESVFGENDKLIFGNGWHYGGETKPIGGGTFDEIQIFDRDLTVDEIKAFAASSSPVDFSAGWDIAADGTLDIFGRKPLTALKGEGVAKTIEATRLEATSNAWFAGSILSPAFVFAGASSSVTQTLSGANAWTGSTTVESGTLEIAASPVQVFGNALVAWYPFEDPSNPGRDFSPRGNNLRAETGFNWSVSPDTKSVLKIGNVMEVLDTVKTNVGLVSEGQLNGFADGVDNSFTLACWMRSDKCHYRSGPFSFGTSSGFRRSNDTSSCFGDSGNMITFSNSSTEKIWDTGEWHHWTMVYDATAAAADKMCYFLFRDGVLHAASDKKSTTFNHATQKFQIKSITGGADTGTGEYCHFTGALDEMIVLNTGNTNDVAKLYALQRTQPEAATGVLPTGTSLTVSEGSVLKLNAANETVARLYGKGTIDLSDNSKLTVTTKDYFEGTVIGGKITDEPGAGRGGLMILFR